MVWPSTRPTILPLLILTPSGKSPFVRVSFNFSRSFISSSACFLVRSGEIKISFRRSELESFRESAITLHLSATGSILTLINLLLPFSAAKSSSPPLFLTPPMGAFCPKDSGRNRATESVRGLLITTLRMKMTGEESGFRTPSTLLLTPNFGLSSEMFFYVFFEKSIISSFRFQVYTR